MFGFGQSSSSGVGGNDGMGNGSMGVDSSSSELVRIFALATAATVALVVLFRLAGLRKGKKK
ncbi:MAG: hypothetical protein K9M45_01605 [Kiritimatiellales bacterium]|nr:hypothetical protein [Kiritimatiellales bacterium]